MAKLELTLFVPYNEEAALIGADSNLVNYISSHDHGHLMARLVGAGIHDEEAFRRAKLAAVLTFTAQGLPMLWMGAEFGEYQGEDARV